MLILHESEVARDPQSLDAVWSGPATFALAGDRASEAWLDAALAALPAPLQRDHFALLTSGSTGEPRLVVGARDRSEALASAIHDAQALEPVARTVLALPLSYSYAFVNQWLWARVLERELVPTPGLAAPDELVATLAGSQDAMLCLVGPQLELLAAAAAGRAFPGVLRVNFAGGRFPAERLAELRELFPNARVFDNYGCTEAMPRLTVRPARDDDAAAALGAPLPGIELQADAEGALSFRSPYGAVGWVDAEGFRAIAPEDWIATGDLAEPDGEGGWRLLGRRAEVFKRYGEKISLPQLLETLRAVWPGEAACYRERDKRGEEGHVLVLAPRPDEAATRELLQALRKGFERTWWPLRVESTDALPRLPNGKPDLVRLRALTTTCHWNQRI